MKMLKETHNFSEVVWIQRKFSTKIFVTWICTKKRDKKVKKKSF